MVEYFYQMPTFEKEISIVLGTKILKSKLLTRLKKISFLGVLGIATGVPHSDFASRYNHSISVAYLTLRYCRNLKISEDITAVAVLLALLHDIGHAPYSHSLEIYLRIRASSGQTHQSALKPDKIKSALIDSFDSMPATLKFGGLEGLVGKIHKLINKQGITGYYRNLENLYDTPFCPDTFDGVNRAWYALSRASRGESLIPELKSSIVLDPVELIDSISLNGQPMVINSVDHASVDHSVMTFHQQMSDLYSKVIYSQWQLSAMMMFTKALEIAYKDQGSFHYSRILDGGVIRKIRRNKISSGLYERIIYGDFFVPLSKNNPQLYITAWNIYKSEKEKSRSFGEIKNIIETVIADKLGRQVEQVIWYMYYPLIWTPNNINFDRIMTKESKTTGSKWKVKWDPLEGTPNKKPKMEIYYLK